MPYEPNDLLLAARQSAELTQGQLAELANAQVERDTGKPGAMDDDYIGKLERGVHRWPNQNYRRALRSILRVSSDSALGFYSTRHRAVTVGGSPRQVNGGDEVERKAFLRVLAGSVAGLAFSDPLSTFAAPVASATGSRRVGLEDVTQIQHVARMYANQDHLFGGGLAAQAVVAQLSTSAELLQGRFAKEATRTALFAAMADLADTAGGMCFDAGQHKQAERCFRFAVGCATEAGDWALRAKALSGLSNLAVHQKQHDEALSYSEMALVRTDRLTPVVLAVMHTRHARALGAMGTSREQDCLAAVRRAEHCFVQRANDEPVWISYYNEARLERDVGRALLGLALSGGDHQEAQRRLSAAVQTFPSEHSRGKALAMVNLAALTMARDDPAYAVQLGHEAIASAGPVRSDRVLEAFRQLRQEAGPHVGLPAVRELDHRIEQLLSTATS